MSMKVRYETIYGEVISETRSGVYSQYVPDSLGNTIALVDDSQTVTDTFSYWPYGEAASRTGTNETPLQYVGTKGYYNDGPARAYVRARHMDTQVGRWLTIDPIKSGVNWYIYVENRPQTLFDPTGLQNAGGGPSVGGGCSPDEATKLQGQFQFICGRATKIDECESGCCDIGDSCFTTTCSDPGTTVRCYDRWNPLDGPVCGKKGSDVCAAVVGRDIVICPAYWTNPNCTFCKLAHEFIHHCGQLGHKNTACFNCVSNSFPSCTGKV